MRFMYLLVLMVVSPAYAENPTLLAHPELMYDLNVSIETIAKKHNLDRREVIKIANTYLLDSPYLFACGKGGSSTIGHGNYIKNNDNINKITVVGENFRSEEVWIGQDSNKRELVIIENSKVKSSVELSSESKDLQFVFFEPEKIRIFNWKELRGGHYLRNCK